jgi:hypothetical protein
MNTFSHPNRMSPKYLFCIFALCIFAYSNARAQTVEYFQTGEEFTGPFKSWKNVKTDFGAKGELNSFFN